MIFTPYASSSSGNLYTLSDGVTSVIIECGVRFSELEHMLEYRVSSYDAAIITHEHGDHARSAAKVANMGVPIYSSQGTLSAIKQISGNLRAMAVGEITRIGTLDVIPFNTVHDAAQPFGYFIRSRADGEKMLFCTDTARVSARMPELDIIAVECNHDEALLDSSNVLNENVRRRILRNHLGVSLCESYLRSADLSRCREIWLLHLSDRYSNEMSFVRRISELCGKPKVNAAPK